MDLLLFLSICVLTCYAAFCKFRQDDKHRKAYEQRHEVEECIKGLRDMTEVQCMDGNWNHDPYMHGMANGMIFALSIFEGGNPEYLDAPEVWLRDE